MKPADQSAIYNPKEFRSRRPAGRRLTPHRERLLVLAALLAFWVALCIALAN